MARKVSQMDERLTVALRVVAPGSAIREGLDNIVRARTGVLLVLAEEDEIAPLITGGIRVDVELSPLILYELAKMDGAIVMASDGSRITHANVHLMPNPDIPSVETGTRHRTAERVAKQIDALVISISASRDVVSLYVDDIRYVLEEMRAILTKANQALQTLEKYKSRLDQVSTSLSSLEFEDVVTLHDVLTVVQRTEMVLMIAREIEYYVLELGQEGRLIRLQLEELMIDVRRNREAVIRDYAPSFSDQVVKQTAEKLRELESEELLSLPRIAEVMGYNPVSNLAEVQLSPRGFRILRKIPRLPLSVTKNMVERFGHLEQVMMASAEELESVEGIGPVRAGEIMGGFERLREHNFLERHN